MISSTQPSLVAEAPIGRVSKVVQFEIVADPLAPGIVLAPQHPDAEPLQNMEQVLVSATVFQIERFAPRDRENAGDRNGGRRSTGGHMGEIDDGTAREIRICFARVAVQLKVVGARRLAKDEDDHPGPDVRRFRTRRILGHRNQPRWRVFLPGGQHFDRRVDRVGRIHEHAKLGMFAS
ncbi:MAG: hypothetical protein M5U09_19545 [Gammaproteobacteria bacterium]|nr:hypothetical protein [Gammaproteobacteria bacterium]